jgi:hypothetical protein
MRPQHFTLLLLLACSVVALAQEGPSFSEEDTKRNEKRWQWHQPYAEVCLQNGDTLAGQPLHFDMDTLYLLPSRSIPLLPDTDMLSIPFTRIDSIWIERGGRITMAQTSGIILGIAAGTLAGFAVAGPVGALLGGNVIGVSGGFAGAGLHNKSCSEELHLNKDDPGYQEELNTLRKWSVFKDSLVFSNDLSDLPAHSQAMRRAYPEKKFRISLAMNWGPPMMKNRLAAALEDAGLPPWNDYWDRGLGSELIDLSLKVSHHWKAGLSCMWTYESVVIANSYAYEVDKTDYTYVLDFTDIRLYGEYVFRPVDRFFTSRKELYVGGGLVLSLPQLYTDIYLADVPENGIYRSANRNLKASLLGLQCRAGYHHYLARNFSLSGGLEVNLYPDLKVPELEAQYGTVAMSAHRLNYSHFRLKIGAHLYF